MTSLRMNAETFALFDLCTRGLRACLVVVDESVPDGEIQVVDERTTGKALATQEEQG